MNEGTRASHVRSEMSGLLAAVATRRDKKAFAQLFNHYAPRVKSYLQSQGADESLAEELVQETFLLLWRKAALFDRTKASAATWIFTIARNLRVDVLRRSRRPEFDPADPAFVPAPALAQDKLVEADQMQARLRAAVAALPRDQATAVRLAFLEDMSHSQIATELAVPLGTVKSRLRLALQRIRSMLDSDSP